MNLPALDENAFALTPFICAILWWKLNDHIALKPKTMELSCHEYLCILYLVVKSQVDYWSIWYCKYLLTHLFLFRAGFGSLKEGLRGDSDSFPPISLPSPPRFKPQSYPLIIIYISSDTLTICSPTSPFFRGVKSFNDSGSIPPICLPAPPRSRTEQHLYFHFLLSIPFFTYTFTFQRSLRV